MTSSTTDPVVNARANTGAYPFGVILLAFLVLIGASLPVLLSFDLWVMGDKSSFLNLDFLLERHYRLGVDACYSYGLLPVFIQHCLFSVFGRGYKPMLGCTFVVMGLMAYFWSLLRKFLPDGAIWLVAIVVLSPLVLLVNPNLPYSIVILSMLFALLIVLQGRPEAAMAVSAIGCFGVPSLPLLLTGMLGASLVLDWWMTEDRSLSRLMQRLAPGLITYTLLFVSLGAFFGFRSIASTALPTNGIRFYRSTGWFGLDACLQFLHPSGYSVKYYVAYYLLSPVSWFVLSLMFLIVVAIRSVRAMAKRKRLEPTGFFFFLCSALIVVFVLFAFGGRGQQEIYQPILVAGTLVAISTLPSSLRGKVLPLFLLLGVLGEVGQAYKTIVAWRSTRPEPGSFGLYVDPVFAAEFSHVIEASKNQKLLLLSYATGEHSYYPSVKSPDLWFLQPGLMFPSDRRRILAQIDQADVVAEDLTRFHFFQDYDPDVRPRLASMCLVSESTNFRIYQRPAVEGGRCQLDAAAK